MTGARKCEICDKKERRCTEKVLFAKFPLKEDICKQWVKVVGKEDLVHLPIEKLHDLRYVCGEHFRKQDFTKSKTRLKKRAIPMLNLIHTPLSDELLEGFPLHMARSREAKAPLDVKQDANMDQVPSATVEVEVVTTSCEKQAEVVSSVPESVYDAPIPSTSRNIERKLPRNITVKSPKEICGDLIQNPGISKLKDETIVKSPKQTCSDLIQRPEKRKLIDETIELTPRKKKLVEDLRKTRCTLRSLRKSAILIDKIKSPVLKEMVINAAKNQSRHSKGRRWTMKNKISALAIHKRSPKTYRFLNQLLPLPSEKTLQNMLKKVPMQPGINKAVLLHLKKTAPKKQEKDKVCCLLFDEMAIKPRLILNPSNDQIEGYEDLGELGRKGEVADHALVFMLQGLHQKYKQPIAFYFTKGTISSPNLANIIKNIITDVSATGFYVLNTVCDQGPTNMGALKLLREGSGPIEGNHYFILNNQKVFIMYDVPHLFKSIRNNFLNHGTIKMGNKKGEWAHLLEVEKENNIFLYLSKISEAHINPKYKTKMRVKYAAQILSTTVSAVLKLLSKAETDATKKEKLMNTAEVILELDTLFDITNGPSGPNDKKKNRRENVSDKTNHLNAWAEWIKKMDCIEFINKKGNTAKHVKCIDGYKITLKSLREIWLFVRKLGFKYLNLRQLNQDALENLFGILRQQSVTNRNPTAANLIAGLKTAIITKCTAQIRGSNCQKDKNFILTSFEDVVFQQDKENEGKPEEDTKIEDLLQEDGEGVKGVEISIPDLLEDEDQAENKLLNVPGQAIVYVSGYLASRLLKNNSCLDCKFCLSIENPPSQETGQQETTMYDYIHLREWWNDRVSLTYPTIHLCNFVQSATNVMENEIVHILHEKNITQLAITIFQLHSDTKWFKCKIHEKNIINLLYKNMSMLLVRRACQKVNVKYAAQEEASADACKKAQQLGKAK